MDFSWNPWASDTPSKATTSAIEPGYASIPGPSLASNTNAPSSDFHSDAETDNPWGNPTASQPLSKPTQEQLLIIYIHGFKGTDHTFGEFPQRLQHLLSQSLPSVNVESIIFPAYETKGELDKAIVRFADWLTNLTVEREVASGGGAGSAKIVLCGHSMGGILAADSLREFSNSRPAKDAPLWPRIIALLAFDTPYLGLNPGIVKNGVEKAAGHFEAAKTVGTALFGSFAGFAAARAAAGSSPAAAAPNTSQSNQQQSAWAKWGGPAAYAIGGAVLAGAAAGGAFYAKDHLAQGFTWATDHLKYVGNLWDEPGLKGRLKHLCDLDEQDGVIFRNFYTFLPVSIPRHLTSRTFVVLPEHGSPEMQRFIACNNVIAEDEVQAHTGIFESARNDGYYELGLASARVIEDAFQRWRSRAS